MHSIHRPFSWLLADAAGSLSGLNRRFDGRRGPAASQGRHMRRMKHLAVGFLDWWLGFGLELDILWRVHGKPPLTSKPPGSKPPIRGKLVLQVDAQSPFSNKHA